MEQGVNEVIVNELSIQFKNLGLIDECINDVKNALVDISKAYKEEQKNIDEAYQRGLDDAWKAARKIIEMTDPPYWGVFNEYKDDLFGKISASEAIEKLKIYEEKQKVDDEIKIGDEVESLYDDRTIVENTIPWIVTKIREGYKGKKSYYGIDAEGTLRNNDFVRKTGRHFDIDKILKQMKVEEDFSDF